MPKRIKLTEAEQAAAEQHYECSAWHARKFVGRVRKIQAIAPRVKQLRYEYEWLTGARKTK